MRWTIMAILICCFGSFPGYGAKFIFDLSKGPVSFTYTTTGRYNPVEIDVVGEDGTLKTVLVSDYYRSVTSIIALQKLIMAQLGAVPWLELSIEALYGNLSFIVTLRDGPAVEVAMEGAPGSVSVRLATEGIGCDTTGRTIQAVVHADMASGKMVIQDRSPEPGPELLLSQRYGIPPGEAMELVERFGLRRVIEAMEVAARYNGKSRAGYIAGGAASLGEAVVSLGDLPPGEIFRISLWGLKYQGILRDSTLYMRLLHPHNGVILRDVRIILTVVGPLRSRSPDIVLWDLFPYDVESQSYRYRFDAGSWPPGIYEIYIDVGRIFNFKLPVEVTETHGLVPYRG